MLSLIDVGKRGRASCFHVFNSGSILVVCDLLPLETQGLEVLLDLVIHVQLPSLSVREVVKGNLYVLAAHFLPNELQALRKHLPLLLFMNR